MGSKDFFIYSTARGYDDDGGYSRGDDLLETLKQFVDDYCGKTFDAEVAALTEQCPLTVEVRLRDCQRDPDDRYELTAEQALKMLDGWIGVEP